MNTTNILDHKSLIAAVFITLLAAGCGGGGSGGDDNTPPTNAPPSANAGPDVSAAEDTDVQLAGSGSDPDGTAVTFAWSQISGPPGRFSDPTLANSVFRAPFLEAGTSASIVLRLTVSDGQSASAVDDVTISAQASDVVVYSAQRGTGLQRILYAFDPQTNVETQLGSTPIAGGNITSQILVSPDRQFVAYTADDIVDGREELYVAAVDGSGTMRVNPSFANQALRIDPVQWSPDGSQLIYTADATTAFVNEVFLLDRDGSNHRSINNSVGVGTTHSYLSLGWSPDGRYIAQIVRDTSNGRNFALDLFDTQATGNPIRRLVDVPEPAEIASLGTTLDNPSGFALWAPDSTALAFIADIDTVGQNELYRVAIDTGATERLNGELVAFGNVTRYGWSPDSTRIGYIAAQDSATIRELYVAMADGTGSTKVNPTLIDGRRVASFAWSPDGSAMAYAADVVVDNETELWVADADGANDVRINGPLVSGGRVGKYEWSPDGTRIAYDARQDLAGFSRVYVSDSDGANNRNLSGNVVTGGDMNLNDGTWSSDGRRMLMGGDTFLDEAFQIFVFEFDADTLTPISPPPVPDGIVRSVGGWTADGLAVTYASEQDTLGVTEAYLSSIDGVRNTKVSGVIAPGGRVLSPILIGPGDE